MVIQLERRYIDFLADELNKFDMHELSELLYPGMDITCTLDKIYIFEVFKEEYENHIRLENALKNTGKRQIGMMALGGKIFDSVAVDSETAKMLAFFLERVKETRNATS